MVIFIERDYSRWSTLGFVTRLGEYQMRFRSIIVNKVREICGDRMYRSLLHAYSKYRLIQNKRRFEHKTSKEIFTEIYAKAMWGRDQSNDLFFSGSGSHDTLVVRPYIDAVRQFLERLGRADVVDIGCGDFAVGSELRRYCRNYIAADIVEPLIIRNRQIYSHLDVDFRVINFAESRLPDADVLLVRQVFQHMSNSSIISALENSRDIYQYIIVTEHLPANADFPHNIEKLSGPDIRLYSEYASGVVLTSTPFNLEFVNSEILCEVPITDELLQSVMRTTAYRLY